MCLAIHRFRWELAQVINAVAWWVTPEPQKSMMRADFAEALEKIKQRHGA